ncbi:MAG: TonB-dependent siderophore receptor [Cyanobacteria bacterium P01_G01_bin.54]
MTKLQSRINLLTVLALVGGQAIAAGQAQAQDIPTVPLTISATPNQPQPATTLGEWQAQIDADASVVQITEIRVEPTETGLQVSLVADGVLLPPSQSVSGNALVLEFAKATLAEPLRDFAPIEGIALVQATARSGDVVEVVFTGSDAVPVVEINANATGLVLGVTPGVAQAGTEDDAIRILVTGEENDYTVPNVSTGTRTDTPLRDIPQSIQVVPQALLDDQGVIELSDALRNVSGANVSTNDARGKRFTLRGFNDASILRDGVRISNGRNINTGVLELSNIEQIEVLKGPASILFGQIEPGGAINLVSERPLSEPTYELGFKVGNRGLVEPSFDFTGPLSADGRVLYRINGTYRNQEYYHRDFNQPTERYFIAPMITWEISDNTDLLLELELRDTERPNDFGLVAVGDGVAPIPFNRALEDPDLLSSVETNRMGYQFEHRFNEDWKIRNSYYYYTFENTYFSNVAGRLGLSVFDETTGTLRSILSLVTQASTFSELQTNVVGNFKTGDIEHTLLAGVDFFRSQTDTEVFVNLPLFNLNTLDIYNPDYESLESVDFSDPANVSRTFANGRADSWGFYIQDQIKLLDNLIVLAGLRYDIVDQESFQFTPFGEAQSRSDSDAVTPRFGLVYQPTEEISLYGSYSRSFSPNTATTVNGDILEPERGEQIEVGVRAELLDGDLVANLAFFEIDKTNVAVSDPDNANFFIASGGQRSRGVELDIIGEIMPGWTVSANYANIDATVTASDDGTTGNRLFNVPEHNLNFWTNYEIQSGSLEGLSLGLGFNFVDERFGNLDNDFTVDSYFLTNAAIAYQRDNWKAALNFRNLFDITYIGGVANSRESSISPGEGLTVIGSFSITF